MSQLIENKIDELIALAKVEGDNNTQIILLCLQGAKKIGADGTLPGKVQDIVRNELMPACMQGQHDNLANKN